MRFHLAKNHANSRGLLCRDTHKICNGAEISSSAVFQSILSGDSSLLSLLISVAGLHIIAFSTLCIFKIDNHCYRWVFFPKFLCSLEGISESDPKMGVPRMTHVHYDLAVIGKLSLQERWQGARLRRQPKPRKKMSAQREGRVGLRGMGGQQRAWVFGKLGCD